MQFNYKLGFVGIRIISNWCGERGSDFTVFPLASDGSSPLSKDLSLSIILADLQDDDIPRKQIDLHGTARRFTLV